MTEGYVLQPSIVARDSTVGSFRDSRGMIGTANGHVFNAARTKTEKGIYDAELRELAIDFLDILEFLVTEEGIDFELPRLITDFKHREAYYEWIFPMFSMGFIIDKNESERGWFIITDEVLGGKRIMDKLDVSLVDAMRFVKTYGR